MSKKELTPEEIASKSRIRKLTRMCILCYKNSIRLHNDSILLFKNGSYPTAYAISIIALEEMGKYMAVSHGLFYGWFETGQEDKFINEVLNATYDHRSKQRSFLNYVWFDSFTKDIALLAEKDIDYKKILEQIIGDFERKLEDDKWGRYFPNQRKLYYRMNALEKEKHKSLYVGFPKKGRNADLSKGIISPFKVNKKKVENQITLLNDHLLLEALQVLKGVSELDFEELNGMITSRYAAKLHKSWPLMINKNRGVILKLKKMPNDK
jgi:AbiV family abortive infection protein